MRGNILPSHQAAIILSFTDSAVLVDRFEQLLHDDFWGDDYWNVCRCLLLNCVPLVYVYELLLVNYGKV